MKNVKGKGKICEDPFTGKDFGNCCRHTLLEAAKWDFNIRGKCWVLRSYLSSSHLMLNGLDVYGGNHPNNIVSLNS